MPDERGGAVLHAGAAAIEAARSMTANFGELSVIR
jgi:hypothetical protein